MTLTEDERAYLATQPLGRLATRRPNGSLQNNPVGFHYDDRTGAIDVTGRALRASRKFQNVAANGAVALVVDDLASRDPWTVRGVEIRGHAEALGNPDVIRIYPRRVISGGLGPNLGMHARDVDLTARAGVDGA